MLRSLLFYTPYSSRTQTVTSFFPPRPITHLQPTKASCTAKFSASQPILQPATTLSPRCRQSYQPGALKVSHVARYGVLSPGSSPVPISGPHGKPDSCPVANPTAVSAHTPTSQTSSETSTLSFVSPSFTAYPAIRLQWSTSSNAHAVKNATSAKPPLPSESASSDIFRTLATTRLFHPCTNTSAVTVNSSIFASTQFPIIPNPKRELKENPFGSPPSKLSTHMASTPSPKARRNR